jgi:hypothetical protein
MSTIEMFQKKIGRLLGQAPYSTAENISPLKVLEKSQTGFAPSWPNIAQPHTGQFWSSVF